GGAAGFAGLISVAVGGTSADVCLVRGGEAEVTVEGRVGAWPLHVPMLDSHTIGAGGGSIARVTDDGTLTVGPESAGAQPGPACYGAGGEEPTVTDAHLVLGRIPSHLLGGEIPLDVERARRAIEERVAQPLGLPLAAPARCTPTSRARRVPGSPRRAWNPPGKGSLAWPTSAIATRASSSRCHGRSPIFRSTRSSRASTGATASSTRMRWPMRRSRS